MIDKSTKMSARLKVEKSSKEVENVFLVCEQKNQNKKTGRPGKSCAKKGIFTFFFFWLYQLAARKGRKKARPGKDRKDMIRGERGKRQKSGLEESNDTF